jgi:GAG-polyprotein viral zinc-finger
MLYADVERHFIQGLRSRTLRNKLWDLPPTEIGDLREIALVYEEHENLAFGATTSAAEPRSNASGQGSSHSATGDSAAQLSNEAAESNESTKPRRRRRPKANAAKSNANASQPDRPSSKFCDYCGRPGHVMAECHTRQRQMNSQPTQQARDKKCVRCGRLGHWAAQCWGDRHVDGSPLAPNGVERPPQFGNSQRSDTGRYDRNRQSNQSNQSQQSSQNKQGSQPNSNSQSRSNNSGDVASRLNASGDVQHQMLVRPNSTGGPTRSVVWWKTSMDA